MLQSDVSFWSVADSLQAQHFYLDIHSKVYAAVKDILTEGKKLSLGVIQARVGEEYGDGQPTSFLLTGLLRDTEDIIDWTTEVETVIDLWRLRATLETLEAGLKEAKKPGIISSDLIADIETRLQDISTNSQSEPIKWLGEIADRVVIRSSHTRDTGVVPGFDTGLPTLDGLIGRIHAGDLGFVGARQGDGKTVLGMQLAMQAQKFGVGCFFQLEMKDEAIAARVLAGGANVSVSEIESGEYDFDTLEGLKVARDKLKSTRVAIDDRAKMTIEQIRDRCVFMKRKHDIRFAVIDHLRLVRAFIRGGNKFDRMEHVTGELKALAKDLEIAIIVLSQVTRASQRRDDPFPAITDLDGGGSLEQDSDWGVSLFRRERYLKGQQPNNDTESREFREWVEEKNRWKDRIEIRCLKRRRGPDGETREFIFDGRRGLIKELER